MFAGGIRSLCMTGDGACGGPGIANASAKLHVAAAPHLNADGDWESYATRAR